MQFNTQAARAAGYTDEEIAAYLAQEQKFNLQGALQAGYSHGEVINFLSPAAAPPEKTGMLRAAADIPVQVGRGVAVGVKALSDVFGADNPVSRAASGVEDFLGGLLSAQAKNDQAEIARIMKEAQDKGVGDQVSAAVKAFATAPVDMLSQALGTAVPVIAGGLAGSIARLGAAGVGAIGTGVGAAMGAGTVKGQIYDAVKQELLANKVPEAEAEKRAQEAQSYGGKNLDQILMGAGIGAAEAAFGAERILTGLLRKGAVKPSTLPAKYRIPTAAATEAVPEMAQAAQEQVAQNIALQREGYDVPTMRGVVGQAALEGIAGMGLGAITGAVQRTEAAKPEAKPPKTQAPAEPQQAEAEAPKPVTGEAGIVRPEEEVKPLTPEEQRELELQQRLYRSQQPKAEELLGEVRGQIQTAPPTTPADIARIRDDHETAVINSLLEQDRKMQSVSDLARLNLERMSQTESLEAATQDADRRVREGRLMGRVQSLIDQNIPFASTAIADINRKFEMIGEAPLDDNERSRVQNIMTMAQGFTDFVKLPSLPVREQDRFAENQAMEALIKERKPRGEVSPQSVRTEAPAPSPVVGQAPVSGRVEESTAVRPEVSPEPSIAEDRQRAEPVAPPVEEPVKPTAPIEAKRGAATRIIAGEEKIPAQWEVVEADSVKAAMTEGKTQPRDRKRAVSNAQIMSIAQNPDFDRLSDTSQTMDYGAPTLTQDGAIVGGNGRFEGVNLSYDTEAGQRYKQSLVENAERLGLDPEQVGAMQKPILVRRITQPADTRKLAIQSNIVAGLELSDMEQAALDAERMAGLDRLEISETGDIPITSRNMDVLRSAFKDYTTEEMGKMMSADGSLSQAGLRRVRNAILYKAYGKTDTLARLVESPDPDLKNVGTALMRASGGMSQMMDAIRSGAVSAEYDIIEDLTGAIETLSSLRASGTKVQEFLAQSELFGDGISGPARAILRFMDNNLRSAKSITEFLNDYAQAVLSAESATGGLFGEAQLPTKQETVERAAQKYEAQRAAAKAQRTLEEQPAGEVRPEARVQPEGEGRAAVSDEEAGVRAALEEKRQTILDMIETKKERREPIPEGWIEKLTEISAQLRGEKVDREAIYSMEVAGHPMFDGPPVLRNLIPIKVKNAEAAQRALDRALELEKQVATEFYGARYALQSAKNAAAKKAAQARIKKLTDQGWDDDALAMLRADTIGELSRLVDVTTKKADAEPKKSLRAGKAQQAADFEQTLRTALNKFGLKDVGLKLINGMTEEGSYAQQLIRIAADSANPIRTLRHEAIHALRELGFFTDAQWQSLSKMAKDKWIDQYLKQRNVDGRPLKAGEESRYDAYMREYNGDMEKITEEAVADAFADFDATKSPSGLMQALLSRLRNLFQSIKSALTKVESPEKIFGKVERGELKAGAAETKGEAKSLRDRATANFLRWFGDSKVVDEKGEPLVMYHGTGADFSVFERSYGGAMGAGMYFTANPKEASEYAEGASGISLIVNENGEFVEGPEGFGNVMPVYLSIKNPYVVRSNKIPRMEDLQAQGYDGVVLSGHWVAFSPNQIKSAIGNNGEYSLTDADIRKSLRKEESRPTPTTAGQSALDTINQLGMGVQPPEPGKVEKIKNTLKNIGENPSLTVQEAKKKFGEWMDWFETKTFSADAKFEADVRRGLKEDMAGMEALIGTMLSVSQSGAVHADAVATQAVLNGRAEFDPETQKWVAVEDKNNITELSRQLEAIADKYGLTKEEAQRVAHTYFVAKNYNGILERNKKTQAQIDSLKEEGKKEEADDLKDTLIFVAPDQEALVEPGLELINQIPELGKMVETWTNIRQNFVKTLVDSYLWSPEYATAMLDNIDYVPFYREEQVQEEEGPQQMIRGLQVKSKEHKLKGSASPVNDVFDNMARWMQYAMNRAIRNHKALQMVDVATEMKVGDRMMAKKVSEPKRGMNVARVWRGGKQEFYDMADPLYVGAFQSLGAVSIPSIKFFTDISNILRKTVVMYPLFSIGQLTQDSVAAIFASGLKPQHAFKIPFLAVQEFIKTMKGWSTTHDDLVKYGVVGVRDFNATVARQDAEITAGIKAPRGAWGKINYMLERIAMSADNAVRQATYIAATDAGLSKAESLEKAFEIINFRRRGSSKLLNLMGQTVPFFYAYLSAQRVAYKTLTGVGISPTERKAALETLAQTTAAVMALSFLYAMANGDDEEYKKTPATVRDRSLIIPGSGGVRIPLRPDFFLFPKVIAEHTYQLITDEGYSDGAKFRKSMADLFANAALSPNPVPQLIKPTLEAGINYSFFEGKPIVGFFEQNKEAGRQFNESTSEFAKMLGQFGASPQMVDHLVRGYFGSVGGLALWGTNFFIEGEPGVPRPELTAHDMLTTMPGVGAFKQKSSENALKVDFYELRDAIAKAKNTYDDMKVRSPEGLEAFLQDEKNLARLAMDKQVTKIGDHLSKIRRAIQQVAAAPEERMSASEKQERIKELRDVEMELLKAVDVKAMRAQAKL